jgi:hypothetical protein
LLVVCVFQVPKETEKCQIPEQTEPEDLSMSTLLSTNNNTIHVNGVARRLASSASSLFSSSDDDDAIHGKLLSPSSPSAAFIGHPKFRHHLSDAPIS